MLNTVVVVVVSKVLIMTTIMCTVTTHLLIVFQGASFCILVRACAAALQIKSMLLCGYPLENRGRC